MIADRDTLAKHLSGMVTYATISDEDEKKMNFQVFAQFQKYLQDTYPLVHRMFQREIIGSAALLYKWEIPKNTKKKAPLLLAAHQDVVPAGDPAAWKYPPFAGTIAEGFLWGRGCLDCKNIIMGHMEALEALIAEGFQPDFDIYLAYGYNEEVSISCESPAADLLAKTLLKRGVRIGVVLDEGGCVVPGSTVGIEGLVANIGLAEKGIADIRLSKAGKGGHAARPGKPNIMADVARAVVALDENPFPYRVLPEIATQYRLLAPYAGDKREIYQDVNAHQQKLSKLLEDNPAAAAKFHTTMAMTMAEGSYRPSIMPTEVSVRVNCRLLTGDTMESALDRIRAVIGQESGVDAQCLGGRDSSPMSDMNSQEYRCLQEVIEELYPGIKVLPSICLGGTDAYFYYPVADYVFRFCGENRVPQNGPAHGVNERIDLNTIDAAPRFFYHYLARY
jgi:carboxypeptidase PM20D1